MTLNLSSLDLESIGYLQAMNMRYSGRLLRMTTIQVQGETKVVVFDAQHTLRFVLDEMPTLAWLDEQSKIIELDIAVRYQEHLRERFAAVAGPESPRPVSSRVARPAAGPVTVLNLDDLI